MSVTRQVTVWCDICSAWEQATGSVRRLRAELKEGGWTYHRGKDFCPECSKKPKPLEPGQGSQGL